jgi:MinD-like ATPase involved in chromosome partitioning or flagellar assembly
MNPGQEHPILIDINTSMTTLDVINGLDKKDFLTGKYWTMETLYAFIMEQGGDIEDFNDLHAKLAYREDPQLPVIPLQLKPAERGLGKSKRSKFTAEQYLTVLRVLKKFFTVIVHDFGTDDDQELTREAFNQLHMLAVLTHTGLATTQMVGNTLEMLWFDFKELIENTLVIFNMTSQPSREALRAIALEKAGKESKSQRLLARLTPQKDKEIQTPGQALAVINEIIEIEQVINPLQLKEVVLVGFDPHLKRESRDHLDQVSETVRAHLWTALHRMLGSRVKFERELLARLPEELPPGVRIRRMHRLAIEVPAGMPEDDEFLRDIPEGFIVVRRKPAENRKLSESRQAL